MALYNEIEPYAAAWLRNLVAAGHIAPGEVDERSIADLSPRDVAGHGQRHFFAGIGVWSYALRLAGVPDDAPIWTGSCPCQPFSIAGRGRGTADERHLWPAWFKLIAECHPAVIFGEQVASRAGRAWFAAVRADLESLGYAVGAADLCAAGVGAPHIRQRLYFVAYADGAASQGWRLCGDSTNKQPLGARRVVSGLADAAGVEGRLHVQERQPRRADVEALWRGEAGDLAEPRGLGDAGSDGDIEHARELPGDEAQHALRASHGDHASVTAGSARDFWAACDWIPCSDGKSRPVEPGTFPLVDESAARVGGVRTLRAPKLRGYGNAIVAEQAAAFIAAALQALD